MRGKKTVSDVQKWRAAIDAVDGTSAQRDALLAVMKDSTKQKYEIADSYGIEARTWVQLKEILPQFDEDGNGSYKGEEIENAIDALNGHSGHYAAGRRRAAAADKRDAGRALAAVHRKQEREEQSVQRARGQPGDRRAREGKAGRLADGHRKSAARGTWWRLI